MVPVGDDFCKMVIGLGFTWMIATVWSWTAFRCGGFAVLALCIEHVCM